ncbi:MAG: site-specific integrase [Propionibacteriaceae bacterium]|nr:site-specific integrase [Propionibacteriaceae bacterium]
MKRRGNGEGSNPVQRKDGRWQILISYKDHDGISSRMTVSAKTARDVREKAKVILGRVGQYQPPKDKKTTVGDFSQQWITTTMEASDRKATTKQTYASLIRSHITKSTMNNVGLDKLTPSRLEKWLVELRQSGLSSTSRRKVYNVLKLILNSAVRDKVIAVNPLPMVEAPKLDTKESKAVTEEEANKILAALDGSRYKLPIELILATGLRRGEALGLRWPDVDFQNDLLHIRQTLARVDKTLQTDVPKTEKSDRVLKMTPRIRSILRSAKIHQTEDKLHAGSVWQDTGFVFCTEHGTPIDPRNALRAVHRATEKAGISKVGLHSLRHGAATTALKHQVPIAEVSKMLGHSRVSTTLDIYAHAIDDASEGALLALDRAMFG